MALSEKEEYTKKIAELTAKILELNRLVEKLAIDASIAREQLDYLREKLNDAQERNRKLDWLLCEATEGRL